MVKRYVLLGVFIVFRPEKRHFARLKPLFDLAIKPKIQKKHSGMKISGVLFLYDFLQHQNEVRAFITLS